MSGNIRLGEDTRSGAIPLETLESSPVKPNSSFWALFFFKKAAPPVRKASLKAAIPARLMCRGVWGESWRGRPPSPPRSGDSEEPSSWSPPPRARDSFGLNYSA